MPLPFSTNNPPQRILVITLRYLGDTLMATPLLRSLKQAYPHAQIDVLTTAANLGVLVGNADIHRVIPLTSKRILSFAGLLFRLFRQYDLAIAAQAGDRPLLCAFAAGKIRIGFVDAGESQSSWKRKCLHRVLDFSARQNHAVLENLRFCQILDIKPAYEVTPPASNAIFIPPSGRFVVLHMMPQWRYKQWHPQGWLQLAAYLHAQGMQIVLTGGPQPEEVASVTSLEQQLPFSVINFAGKLSLADMSQLLAAAMVFIGPDTGVTHLAAAIGIPVIALFGPTDPRIWGPWPYGYASEKSPFRSFGSQQQNNVYLLQGITANNCMPCQQEGCDQSRQSHSQCLDDLSADAVITYLNALLG